MSERKRYRKTPGDNVAAVQLALDTEGFQYTKWGGRQICKPGDWLVDNSGEVYTVDKESFAETYEKVGIGCYEKTHLIWAEQATEPGHIHTKEGQTAYQAGDYLVSNDEEGTDTYAISAARFRSMYEEVPD